MFWSLAADAVLILHLVFVLLVVAGGFLTLRWPALAWIQLPSALWAVALEFGGWVCPLTPLEQWLRGLAGEAGYRGSFVQHYLLAWLYPAGLDRRTQLLLGLVVILVNLFAYGLLLRRLFSKGSASRR